MKKLIISILVLILLLPGVFALTYSNESMKRGLTDFEWCFQEPWGDKESYKENWDVYVDNLGCEIESYSVYAVTPVKITDTIDWEEITCLTKDDKSQPKYPGNDSYPTYEDCTTTTKSKTQSRIIEEWYDLTKGDYLITADSKICYKATRKAKTGDQACDMNFRLDLDNDGSFDVDVKDDGKAWWNTTFNNKRAVTIINNSVLNTTDNYPYLVALNSSVFDLGDLQNDCKDIFVVNSTENGELERDIFNCFISENNVEVFINDTVSATTNKTIYLYYNSSATMTDDFTYLERAHLHDHMPFGYNFEESSASPLIDWQNQVNSSCSNCPTPQFSGKVNFAMDYETSQADKHTFDANSIVNSGTNSWCIFQDIYFNSISDWNFGGQWNNVPQLQLLLNTGAGNVINVDLYDSGGNPRKTSRSTTAVGATTWYNLGICSEGNTRIDIYINGENKTNHVNLIGGVPSIDEDVYGVGGNVDLSTYLDGMIDNYFYFNGSLNQSQIDAINNQNLSVSAPFYAEIESVIGAEQINSVPTGLDAGIFIDGVNSSLEVQEDQEFLIWANYSWDANSTAVNDSVGLCEFTADYIITEYLSTTAGTNASVCNAGCTYSNKTVQFTGLHAGAGFGYIEDFYRVFACHNAGATHDFYIHTNCSNEVYTIPGSEIVACSSGTFTNFVQQSANCSGATGVQMNIWSDAPGVGSALILINDTTHFDRELNESGTDMIYNSTTGLWVSDHIHEYFDHGSHNISVNCTATGNIENQTTILEMTVANVAPTNTLNTIWDALLGFQTLTTGVNAKYPLTNTINISGICLDTDLQNLSANLSYTANGTMIQSNNFTSIPNIDFGYIINYTQGLFDTTNNYLDGTLSYTFSSTCWDNQSNFSTASSTFFATNNAPTGSWDDGASISVGSVPYNLTFTCTDDENETMGAFILYNGTTNESQVPEIGGFLFNETAGTYNLTLYCNDSFRNSTQDDILVTFTPACLFVIGSPCAGCRYPDTNITMNITCSNGVTPDECYYRINDFANISISNCSETFSFNAERGWNKFQYFSVNGGMISNTTTHFWAKEYDSSIFDYPVIWFMIFGIFAFFLAARFTNAPIFDFLSGVGVGFLGYELLAVSMYFGGLVLLTGFLYSLYSIASSKKSVHNG